MEFKSKIKTIEWVDTYSKMVDQTVVPYEYKFVNITTGEDMFNAIRNMIVRGAPAIGIAGAHGVILFAVSPFAAILSAPTTTISIMPLLIKYEHIPSVINVTGIPSIASSKVVIRAPC